MRTSSPLGRTSPCSVGGADGNTAASPGASCATAGSLFGASNTRVRNTAECSVSGPAVAAVAGPGACNGMPRRNPACETRARRVRGACDTAGEEAQSARVAEATSLSVMSAVKIRSGASPVPVQMWAGGEPSPGADVARVRLKAQENI